MSDPHASSAERYMMHLLATVGVARNARLEAAFKQLGMSAAAVRTLAWIQARPDTTMTELAAGVFFDRTTLTRTVDHLVEEGYVIRSSGAGDRRKVTLSLTDKADEAFAEWRPLIDSGADPIAGVLDAGALSATIAALLKLHAAYVSDPVIRAVQQGAHEPAQPIRAATGRAFLAESERAATRRAASP